MKKIPESITVTVEKNGDYLELIGLSSALVDAPGYSALPMPRTRKYNVTYWPDPKGAYVVRRGKSYPYLNDSDGTVHYGRYVCFLRRYCGLRVSRRVEKVNK